MFDLCSRVGVGPGISPLMGTVLLLVVVLRMLSNLLSLLMAQDEVYGQ